LDLQRIAREKELALEKQLLRTDNLEEKYKELKSRT